MRFTFVKTILICGTFLALIGCGSDGPPSFNLFGAGLTITTNSLPNAVVGLPYDVTLTATGGLTPYSWSLATGDSLPTGLALNASTGAITGVPTVAGGPTSFNVEVSDSAQKSGSSTLSITVDPTAALSVTTSALPDAYVGTPYSLTLAAGNGTQPYSWAVSSSTADQLPVGLSLNQSTGEISGTPTSAAQAVQVTLEVLDSAVPPATAQATLSLTVNAQPTGLTVVTTSLPDATAWQQYDSTVMAAGSALTPFTWSLVSGQMPLGTRLYVDPYSTGTECKLIGRPRVAGTTEIMIEVTDTAGATAQQSLTLNVAIDFGRMPDAYVGTEYNAAIPVIGSDSTFAWTAQAADLPPGLSLGGTGSVTGTPTATGTYTLTATAVDSTSATSTDSLTITVKADPGALTIVTKALPRPHANAVISVPYSARIDAAGGDGTGYQWRLSSGSLPPGIIGLDPTASPGSPHATLSGTATAAGRYTIGVTVTDQSAGSFTATFVLVVIEPTFDHNGDGYGDIVVGAPYDNDHPASSSLPLSRENGSAGIFFGAANPAMEVDASDNYSVSIRNIDGVDHSATEYEHFGWSVSSAGDFNGDGYDDLVASAPADNHTVWTGYGAVYIFFGSASSSPNSMYASNAGITITGRNDGDQLGISVARIGDFNGDGYDDIVVGARGESDIGDAVGGAWIFLGRDLSGSQNWTTANANIVLESFEFTSSSSPVFGDSVSSLGDFNNDGLDDVIVSHALASENPSSFGMQGAAYVYLGRPMLATDPQVTILKTEPEFILTGEFTTDRFGSSLAGAGDFNGDGYDDAVIGARDADDVEFSGSDSGALYLFLGRAASPGDATITIYGDAAELKVLGSGTGSLFGNSVAGVGDLNGDGYSDVAIGAYGDDSTDLDAGAAFIFLGRSLTVGAAQTLLSATDADIAFTPSNASDALGFAVAGAGDVNGDGYDDFAVGAPYSSDGGSFETTGAVYIFLGAQMLPASVGPMYYDSVIAEGFDATTDNQLRRRFGNCVAGQ